jgi:hypothetical protein
MAVIYDLDNEYGGKIIADSDTPGAALTVDSAKGSPTIAPFAIANTSTASGAVMTFGSFISVTSILGIAATGAGLGFDKVIPVSTGPDGVMRGIPLLSLASLVGAGAF